MIHSTVDTVQIHHEHYVNLGWSIIQAHGVQMFWPSPNNQWCACRDGGACPSPGKHPVGKWKDRPTATLRDLIRSREMYRSRTGHESNWAVVCGRSNLAVLDIDQHAGGPDGLAEWAKVIARRSSLPITPQDSRNHTFFKLPGEAIDWPTKIQLAPGVELFTGNPNADHLVYIPPSEHPSGASYRWLRGVAPWEVETASMPAWLIELAEECVTFQKANTPAPATATIQQAMQQRSGAHHAAAGGNDVISRARAYLLCIPGAVAGQRGHDVTFKAACKLVIDFGLTPTEALPLLQQWNATCSPSWSDADLLHKLAGADRRPEPRGRLRDASKSFHDDPEFAHLRNTAIHIIRPGRRGPRSDPNRITANGPASTAAPVHIPKGANYDDLACGPEASGANECARESAAAAATRQLIADIHAMERSEYHCPTPYHILQGSDSGPDVAREGRCGSWRCPGCGKCFRKRWEMNLRHCFATAPDAPAQLYAVWIPRNQWDAVRQRITRTRLRLGAKHGRFVRFDANTFTARPVLVVTTADCLDGFDGVKVLDGAAALDKITKQLELYAGKSKPVSTSKEWALPDDDSDHPNEYTTIGKLDSYWSANAAALIRFVEICGAAITFKSSPHAMPLRIQGKYVIEYPEGFTRYQRHCVRHGLVHGWMPGFTLEAIDVTGPPPEEPPEDDPPPAFVIDRNAANEPELALSVTVAPLLEPSL